MAVALSVFCLQGEIPGTPQSFCLLTETCFFLGALGLSQVQSLKSVECFNGEKALEFISIQRETSGSTKHWCGMLLVLCVTEHISFTGLIFEKPESLNVFIFMPFSCGNSLVSHLKGGILAAGPLGLHVLFRS